MDGDNMLTVILLLSQECCYSAFLSKAFLLWQSHLKKTGLLDFVQLLRVSLQKKNLHVFLNLII